MILESLLKRIKSLKRKKYLYELMYYDWVEVELYMREYKVKKTR